MYKIVNPQQTRLFDPFDSDFFLNIGWFKIIVYKIHRLVNRSGDKNEK